MNVLTCTQCGEVIPESAKRCPVCGMGVPDGMSSVPSGITPCEQRLYELLARAKQCQLVGDISSAIGHAQKALLLSCDACRVHALLGHLYEQAGNAAAARQHFQRALEVSTAPTDPVPAPGADAELAGAPPARGAWLMAVLVGCILVSGLAALFTLFPGERRNIGHGTILQPRLSTSSLNTDARWTLQVPSPIEKHAVDALPEPPSNPLPAAHPVEVADVKPVAPASPVTPERAAPTEILGPSASADIPAEATTPTIEQADQAYFHGKYERAVSIYEEILHAQEQPDPRMLQNLAWCYQQLGNSVMAATHLKRAVQGYRSQLVADPLDPNAQQGCRSCEAALVSLQAAP